ncbi:efflux RND transporter periplasmic adaptor subunit [Methylotuvimicrobium sp.]|uniref:efflux RND transporter periplasmic adaptor subunit n=1 Tax=Methylotuvimicrobium sp. TaxID=2822413 RepID=UPI003D6531E4
MNKSLIIAAPLLLAVGLSGGYWLATRHQSETQNAASSTTTSKIPLFYRSPMNPSVTSPVPAKDAMGMDYVPVYADDSNGATSPSGTVKIDPVTEQNIGVRTAVATQETLSHIIRAVGRVAYDEEKLVRLHPKTEGWIETLRVDKTGEWVKKDDDLLSIYSPQLVVSQQEYILALNNLKALENSPIEDIRRGAEELLNSSRERLKLLDVPPHQLHDLTRTHQIKKSLHIHTPAAGIVMNIGAREGQYVTPATELYMIADLSTVWVYADIYEYELPWVKVGDPVEMQLAGVPGRTFKGHLAYIYPYAEPKTRSIKVRLAFDNSELLLKPDMYAQVAIMASRQLKAVTLPSEAIVRSGTREQVFVMRAPGKFEPRPVTVGLTSNGRVAVLEGVKAGEEVVTSAQFLIDSESKLREATAKMFAPDQPAGRMNTSSMPNRQESNNADHRTEGKVTPVQQGDHRHD